MSPLFHMLVSTWFTVAALLIAMEASSPSKRAWAWVIAWIAWPAVLVLVAVTTLVVGALEGRGGD